jgi:hypothetical protein
MSKQGFHLNVVQGVQVDGVDIPRGIYAGETVDRTDINAPGGRSKIYMLTLGSVGELIDVTALVHAGVIVVS